MLALRFIGVLNAAVWLGAAIFFTFVAGPAFFTPEIKALFRGSFWPGVMAQQVIERFFYLQQICGVIAVVHLVAEWFYLGRPLQRLNVALLSGLLVVGFAGGLWLHPKMHRLHLTAYGKNAQYQEAPRPEADRAAAWESWKAWHRAARVIDLLAMAALLTYFWRVTHPSDDLRVLNAGATPQFRG